MWGDGLALPCTSTPLLFFFSPFAVCRLPLVLLTTPPTARGWRGVGVSCRCAALRVGKKKGAEQRRNRGEAGVPCIDQAQPESQRGPGRVTGTAYGAKAR